MDDTRLEQALISANPRHRTMGRWYTTDVRVVMGTSNLIMFMLRTCVLGLLTVLCLRAFPVFAQTPTAEVVPPALALARDGRAAEAWNAWSRMPAGEARLRIGIDVAATLGDIERGLQLYEQLRDDTQSIAITALHPLALAVAGELARSTDTRVDTMLVVTACRGALQLDVTHVPCRNRLESMATDGPAASRAFALYAMADVGHRPFPALFKTYESTLSANSRLMLASQYQGLPPAERVSLVQGLLASPDQSIQYQALLVLGGIDHSGAASSLAGFDAATSPLRYARTIGLAQHGEAASLAQVAEMLGWLDNSLKVPAALALARVQDARGALALNEVLASDIDVDRLRAAEAIARLSPQTAQPAILEAIHGGSPIIRPMALSAAGAGKLGANRAVYGRLVSLDPQERALAVAAIAETGSSPAAEVVPAPAPRP